MLLQVRETRVKQDRTLWDYGKWGYWEVLLTHSLIVYLKHMLSYSLIFIWISLFWKWIPLTHVDLNFVEHTQISFNSRKCDIFFMWKCYFNNQFLHGMTLYGHYIYVFLFCFAVPLPSFFSVRVRKSLYLSYSVRRVESTLCVRKDRVAFLS